MSFIYGESNAAERNNLAAHLRGCPDCQAKVNEWQAVQKALNSWPVRAPGLGLAAKRPPVLLVRPVLKWAAVAVLLLSAGFGLGQFASASVEADKVRARIESQVRQELRQEMTELLRNQVKKAADETLMAANEQTKTVLANYVREIQTKHEQDGQALYSALRKVDAQRLADYLLLKKDLDTVAVNTDADFRITKQQIIQLVDYNQPASSPRTP